MNRRVVITGMGAVSPYGRGVETLWSGLLSGESAMQKIRHFDPAPYRSGWGGEVPREVYDLPNERERLGAADEDSAYFLSMAVEEALTMAGVGPGFDDNARVGCVLGTLCAGLRNLRDICHSFENRLEPELPVGASLASYQLDHITRRHNLTGPSSMVSTACSSTTDALGYAFDLVRHGDCDACVSGGGDVLSEAIHAAFNGLQSITTSRPRPFDQARDGFFIGEGAGAFFIETLDSAMSRGARIYAEIVGYGLSNTGYHLTATSEDGAGEALALLRALEDAGLRPDHIDFINCHGTGTRYNDGSEIRAINHVFGEHARNIHITSNKASIGHCMGVAGALEAASTAMTLDRQLIPPTAHSTGDETELVSQLVTGEPLTRPIRYALSQSFGFGGACSCIALARHDQHTPEPAHA